MLIAAVISAARTRRSAACKASPSSAVDGCVPLMSARPSFGASVRGVSPARESAAAPDSRRSSCQASPSPMSTSARCASGARSPLAPTDPRDGTTGCTPRFSRSMSRSSVPKRDAGEALRQHIRPQGHRRAHDRNRKRVADAGGVTAKQIDLQLGERVGSECEPRRSCRTPY